MIYQIVGIIALVFLAPLCSSVFSANIKPQTGLVDHLLRPCPSSPNCVCSEFPEHSSYVHPIKFTGTPERAWIQAVDIVKIMGGRIIRNENGYLHATFTSRIFRFVDDMELRIDRDQKVIHLRSSSRTGYWDLGINKQRAERFRTDFMNTSE